MANAGKTGILFRIVIMLILYVPPLTGCAPNRQLAPPEIHGEQKQTARSADLGLIPAEALWITYWNPPEAAEIPNRQDFPNLCLFAAVFDENGKPYIKRETAELSKALGGSCYLTFVNDKMTGHGNSLKDTELLYTLFGTLEKAEAHVEEVLQTAEAMGVQGIEIDYERIRMDMKLWAAYQTFLQKLWTEANRRNLALRVCLEPGIPIESLSLPEGPEYVVMCYNLHGPKTSPGPKADKPFLQSLAKKIEHLPNTSYALANGGFLWKTAAQETIVTSITTQEAAGLADRHLVTPTRDAASDALTFSFREADTSCTVWYGDKETLAQWKAMLEEYTGGKVDISIWRWGG